MDKSIEGLVPANSKGMIHVGYYLPLARYAYMGVGAGGGGEGQGRKKLGEDVSPDSHRHYALFLTPFLSIFF